MKVSPYYRVRDVEAFNKLLQVYNQALNPADAGADATSGAR